MINEFDRLADSEVELMLKAPILACILIAGADGEIDQKEIKGAIEVARKKQKKSQDNLLAFYSLVAEDFEDKLKIVLQSYPADAAHRNPKIIDELSMLNAVLPKLERTFAIAFYGSVRDIALKIAQSSGGLLGLNKIGDEEAKLVELPMIKDPSR